MQLAYSVIKAISMLFEFRSRECLFHTSDCSMRLLYEIAVLLGVYKLRILAVGDRLTDVSSFRVVCLQKSRRFGRISACRWLSQMANKLQL